MNEWTSPSVAATKIWEGFVEGHQEPTDDFMNIEERNGEAAIETTLDTHPRKKNWLTKRFKPTQTESQAIVITCRDEEERESTELVSMHSLWLDERTPAAETGEAASLPIEEESFFQSNQINHDVGEEVRESESVPTKNSVERSASDLGVPTNIFMPKVVETKGVLNYMERRRSLPNEMERTMFELIESAFVDGAQLGGEGFYVDEDSDSYFSSPPSFFVSRTFSDEETCKTTPQGISNPNSTGIPNLFLSTFCHDVMACHAPNGEDSPLNHQADIASASSSEVENGHEVPLDEYEMSLKADLNRPHLLKRVFSSRLGSRPTKASILSLDNPSRSKIPVGPTKVPSILKNRTVVIVSDEDKLSTRNCDERKTKFQWERIERVPSPIFE